MRLRLSRSFPGVQANCTAQVMAPQEVGLALSVPGIPEDGGVLLRVGFADPVEVVLEGKQCLATQPVCSEGHPGQLEVVPVQVVR